MKNLLPLILTILATTSGAQEYEVNNSEYLSETIVENNVVSDIHPGYSNNNFKRPTADSTVFKKRKPGSAFLWSLLVPGGGQFYNGQTYKGGLMLGGGLFGLLLLLDGSKNGSNSEASYTAGSIMLVGSSLWSVIDAPISANKLNRENGITLNITPSFQQQTNYLTNRNQLSIGLQITLSF